MDTFGYVARGDRTDAAGISCSTTTPRRTNTTSAAAVLMAWFPAAALSLRGRRRQRGGGDDDNARRIYEKRGVTVPDPIDSSACWGTDEFAYGSYSNISAAPREFGSRSGPVTVVLRRRGDDAAAPGDDARRVSVGDEEAARISEKMRELNKAGKLAR